MAVIEGPPANVIRNKPITTELHDLLDGAADATGIQKVVIVSGGQVSNHTPSLKGVIGGWTGSHRHDNGRAADIEMIKDGTKLKFTDTDGSEVEAFVTAAAARGANGIGAGVNYMGKNRIHVGFGNSPSDHQKIVWGAAGASANAPAWLVRAAARGWDNPIGVSAVSASALAAAASGQSIVTARGGLWLRKGPGLGFDRTRLLEAGTAVTVVGFDGEWARVDLENDGLVDGHAFAAFLKAADTNDADDGMEEPAEEEVLDEAADDGRRSGRSRTARSPHA